MQENRRIQGHLFGAFSVLVWGTTFVSTKVLLRAFTPLEIMVARFTLGYPRPRGGRRQGCGHPPGAGNVVPGGRHQIRAGLPRRHL